jgi:hypothetical protein
VATAFISVHPSPFEVLGPGNEIAEHRHRRSRAPAGNWLSGDLQRLGRHRRTVKARGLVWEAELLAEQLFEADLVMNIRSVEIFEDISRLLSGSSRRMTSTNTFSKPSLATAGLISRGVCSISR